MFPGNHPEPNLGLRLFYKAGDEKMAFFEVGVGKSNYKILLMIICVLIRKWYHIKVEILNFNIKKENHKSVHYSPRYGLKSMAGPKKNQAKKAYKLTLILLLMSATHVRSFRRIHEEIASVILI